jgi:hypothetical protein
MKKVILSVVIAAVVFTGCGGGDSSTAETLVIPTGYEYKVINNRGDAVEGQVGKRVIKLYSDSKAVADPKSVHKGVVVNINGVDSKTMPIQESYIDDDIVVAVYDEGSELITAVEAVSITDDVPVVLVNLSI